MEGREKGNREERLRSEKKSLPTFSRPPTSRLFVLAVLFVLVVVASICERFAFHDFVAH